MREINTDRAPHPLGHYSQAIVHNGFIFVSGQLPLDPETGNVVGDSIEVQMERTLANIAAILESAGSGLDHVLKVTIYLADLALAGRANAVYARIMGNHRPARAMVPTLPLPRGCLVEIEAIAALGETQ